MTRSLPLTALVLLLSGCNGESKLGPPPGPPQIYPAAIASNDCAPWDGPAVDIYLLSAPGDSLPPSGRHIQIALWMGLDSLPGRRLSWPEDGSKGVLFECPSAESCTALYRRYSPSMDLMRMFMAQEYKGASRAFHESFITARAPFHGHLQGREHVEDEVAGRDGDAGSRLYLARNPGSRGGADRVARG